MAGGTLGTVQLEDVWNYIKAGTGDEDAEYITTTEMTHWFNHYMRDFCRRTGILDVVVEYTWPADTKEVALTTVLPDVYHPTSNPDGTQENPRIYRVLWTGSSYSKPLLVSPDEVYYTEVGRDYSAVKGTPVKVYFDVASDMVGLQPVPSASGTLKVWYQYSPKNLANSAGEYLDYMLTPWWPYIAAACLYRAKLKDRDHFSTMEAQIEMNEYQRGISLCKIDRFRRGARMWKMEYVNDYYPPDEGADID